MIEEFVEHCPNPLVYIHVGVHNKRPTCVVILVYFMTLFRFSRLCSVECKIFYNQGIGGMWKEQLYVL